MSTRTTQTGTSDPSPEPLSFQQRHPTLYQGAKCVGLTLLATPIGAVALTGFGFLLCLIVMAQTVTAGSPS